MTKSWDGLFRADFTSFIERCVAALELPALDIDRMTPQPSHVVGALFAVACK